jgi:hypothetical protein
MTKISEGESCPTCGALPCDQINAPPSPDLAVGGTAALADEIEGVISDLESSGWARAGQCIRTLKIVAASLATPPPSTPPDTDAEGV